MEKINPDNIINPPCAECNQQKDNLESCHVCNAPICKECLDENGAYTYPDSKPYCSSHQPN